MRDFNEADRKKKHRRVQIQENPANLSEEGLSELAKAVKASLKDGYLSCPRAFKIADEARVPKIAVGEIVDRLGIRVTNCQIGCFKVDKTPYDNSVPKKADGEIITRIEALNEASELTCANVFDLALQLKSPPKVIADAANLRNLKIHRCQLGCF